MKISAFKTNKINKMNNSKKSKNALYKNFYTKSNKT